MDAMNHDNFGSFKKRIQTAFELFDLKGKQLINKRDVGTVIRYLGYFPSQADVEQIILPQLKEIETSHQNNTENIPEQNSETPAPNKDEFSYHSFQTLMLDIMKRNLYPCDDEDIIFLAFRTIQQHYTKETDADTETEEKTISESAIIAAMAEYGGEHGLDPQELEEFLNMAIITTNKHHKDAMEAPKNDQESIDDSNATIHYDDYVEELLFQLRDHA